MALIVLDYRSRPRRRRRNRNRLRLRLVGFGAAALFVFVAYWLGRPPSPTLLSSTTAVPPVKQIDPLLELEERCRSYRPSGSAPVYLDPASSPGDHVPGNPRLVDSDMTGARVHSPSADEYIRKDPRFVRFTDSGVIGMRSLSDVIYRPIPLWSKFLQANSAPGGDCDYALLFLHERCAKGGSARLVAVELSTGCFFREQLLFSVINSDRIDRTQGVRRGGCDLSDLTEPRYVIKFFEGEADASDASHFTIRFNRLRPGTPVSPYAIEVTDESAILDGWLLSDDRVQLKVRDEKSGQ